MMDILQFAPIGVIAAAIAATGLFKKFAPAEAVKRLIWLPSLLIGVIGAVLLDWGKEWHVIAWNAILYASLSSYIVLVQKRGLNLGAKRGKA